mmetsp:Transcript_11838/g.21487  ORF Transcript_11838/g.21487 Transcript_11838/m.21487 type:complete len:214 (-) Transcript_11838:712-1353(-)
MGSGGDSIFLPWMAYVPKGTDSANTLESVPMLASAVSVLSSAGWPKSDHGHGQKVDSGFCSPSPLRVINGVSFGRSAGSTRQLPIGSCVYQTSALAKCPTCRMYPRHPRFSFFEQRLIIGVCKLLSIRAVSQWAKGLIAISSCGFTQGCTHLGSGVEEIGHGGTTRGIPSFQPKPPFLVPSPHPSPATLTYCFCSIWVGGLYALLWCGLISCS